MATPRIGSSGIATTKGDLYVLDANGELERLPVGADRAILTANSALALGVGYVNPITAFTAANQNTNSNAFGDITDFANFTLLANTDYAYTMILPVLTAGVAIGIQFATAFAGTYTSGGLAMLGATSGAAIVNSVFEPALGTSVGPAATGPGNTSVTGRMYTLQGFIRVGAVGGVFKLQYRSGVAGGTAAQQVDILAGATARFTRV